MNKYIFIDTWVFSKYARGSENNKLSTFIKQRGLTIALDSTTFVELYNPGWQQNPENERNQEICDFLSEHPCAIIDPLDIRKYEIIKYPNKLEELPIKLDFRQIPDNLRSKTILNFLRADESFTSQDKDIRKWAIGIKKIKSTWFSNVENIKTNMINNDMIKADKKGNYQIIPEKREEALLSLDRRSLGDFTHEERIQLGEKIVPLFMKDFCLLKGIRTTSLAFWYAYIEKDKSYLPKNSPSDLLDFHQMTMMPYCTFFTLDRSMQHIANKIKTDLCIDTTLISADELVELD